MNKKELMELLSEHSIAITNLPFDKETVYTLTEFFLKFPHVQNYFSKLDETIFETFKPYLHSNWGANEMHGWVMYIRGNGDVGWDFQRTWELYSVSGMIYHNKYEVFDYKEL